MAFEKLIAVDKVANKIRFYDVRLREIKVIDGPEPCVHELALTPDRRTAFVPLYGDGIYGGNKRPNNKILAVDLVRMEIADVIALGEFTAPHGMTVTRDGRLWVTCDIPNKLLCVNPQTRVIEAAYDNPGKGGHLVEMLADESKLYVSAKKGPLGVFDLARRAFVAAVPLAAPDVSAGNGTGSEGIVPAPDGRHLIAIDNDRSDLRVIDVREDREVDRVPLQPFVFTNPKRSRLAKLAFSANGRWLVVTSYASALAWVIDAADLSRQRLVPVAKGPMGTLFEPGGRTALVSSHDSGLLTRIDLEEGRAVAAYDGGSGIRHAPPAVRRGSARGWSTATAVNAPVGGEADARVLARARDADIGEPALLLEARRGRSSSARWCGNRPSSQPGRNTVSNSSPLAECSVMIETASSTSRRVGVHHQRDVLEEAASVLEVLHGAHELLEVLEPARRVGRAVVLPHLGVAGLVEDRSRRVRCAAWSSCARQRSKLGDQIAQRARAASASVRRSRPRARAACEQRTPRARA
jgi:DNA-binding beta-propeller fold protein YncE